jgi:hypothetical protein
MASHDCRSESLPVSRRPTRSHESTASRRGSRVRQAHNRRQARPRDRISDPFRPIIGALNSYLHAYHMFRAEARACRGE